MGTATMILGLRVQRSQLYEEKETKGCEHEHHSKFCPECGAEGSKAEETLRDFVKDGGNEAYAILGYPVVEIPENLEVFVIRLGAAVETERELSEHRIAILKRGEEINKFKDEMTKVGLWDPNEFGVWASYSY